METTHTYEVKEITWPGKTFATKRAKLGFDKLTTFFAESYKTIYTALNKLGIELNDPPCAIYFSVDTLKKETDLAAAVPIPEPSKIPAECEKITILKSRALLLTYYGSYKNMTGAYATLDEYVANHQLKKSWVIEEYFSDPIKEPDPAKWKTNIYYIIK